MKAAFLHLTKSALQTTPIKQLIFPFRFPVHFITFPFFIFRYPDSLQTFPENGFRFLENCFRFVGRVVPYHRFCFSFLRQPFRLSDLPYRGTGNGIRDFVCFSRFPEIVLQPLFSNSFQYKP